MKNTKAIMLIAIVLAMATTAIAQVVLDETPPTTTKTYGDPNEPALITLPTCEPGDGGFVEGDDVQVNGHLINTTTTITLTATDDDSGVDGTFFTILVPTGCNQGDLEEWVGLDDHNIYQDETTCELATANVANPEGQNCAATFWNVKKLEGNPFEFEYNGPFVIPQESTHKICFFSVDKEGNDEEVQCQVALVDDAAPNVTAWLDHHIVDLEIYNGGNNDNYFLDPKCTWVYINATDTHEIDDVQVGVLEVLEELYVNLQPDSQQALDEYFAADMHNMSSLENGLVELDEGSGLYRYWFCPALHIYHLYDMNVLSSGNFTNFLEEDLVLGEFEVPIWVNDTAGRETHITVDVTIVDLTVPLEAGWNLRSTPITLEGDEFWPSNSIDAVLRWDSSLQSWELVTDNSIEPLDALYIHATDRNQIGYVFERDLTAPPVRTLEEGWNLIGVALELSDYWTTPDSCDSNKYGYDPEICYLTYLSDDYGSCIAEDALAPIVFGPDGNIALELVVSPAQYLSYSSDWGSWYFEQDSWIWIPEIDRGGFDIDNACDEYVSNFEGYWAFMQNPDMLPGQTFTPLPL